MAEKLVPLGGHAVFLLFIQLALLLIVARIGAELAKRVSLPAVVGELAAGISLGPTMFGHFAGLCVRDRRPDPHPARRSGARRTGQPGAASQRRRRPYPARRTPRTRR